MTRSLTFACAAIFGVSSTAALAQAAPAGKPISRSAYMGTVEARFATVDTNHDGVITRAELVAQQQRDLDQARAKINGQFQAKFKQLDTNHDGQLSMQEFLAAVPTLNSENTDEALKRLDANHDGKISADEFRAPELAKFAKVDANHDGVVTPEEIKAAAGRK
ncbi:MAG: EF-hand domain-containing protein [Sphingomonas sp.]